MTKPDLAWERESNPTWDADKRRVIGAAPSGTFDLSFKPGERLPGEWWCARDAEQVVAYARLDIGWGGDAEIWIAVHPEHQRRGVGSFVLAELEREAGERGINYVYNVIGEHAGRDLVHDWLVVRGFRGPLDGDLRKRINTGPPPPRPSPVPRDLAYNPLTSGDRGPGGEEFGGYVDVDEHRY